MNTLPPLESGAICSILDASGAFITTPELTFAIVSNGRLRLIVLPPNIVDPFNISLTPTFAAVGALAIAVYSINFYDNLII